MSSNRNGGRAESASSTCHRAFQYQDLPSDHDFVRLLTPGSAPQAGGIGVHWEIQTFSLTETPPYYALSYTWGCPFGDEEIQQSGSSRIEWNEAGQHIVLSDGTQNKGTFNLRPDLNAFLQDVVHCEGIETASYVWIDAVCINQSDSAERSSQVRMMGSVYEGAKEVLIWLGPSNSTTNCVARTLQSWDASSSGTTRDKTFQRLIRKEPQPRAPTRSMPSHAFRYWWWYWFNGGHRRESGIPAAKLLDLLREKLRTPDQSLGCGDDLVAVVGQPLMAGLSGDRVDPNAFRRSLRALTLRTYWQRVWIVQEVFLNPSVKLVCGSAIFSFDTFFFAWALFKAIDERNTDVDWKTGFETIREIDMAETSDRSMRYHPGSSEVEIWSSEQKVLEYSRFGFKSSFMRTIDCKRRDWLCKISAEYNVFSLIRDFGHMKCAVPHDKVYGFLGLQAAANPLQRFRIDYGISVSEVFLDTFTFFSSGRTNLEDARTLWDSLALRPKNVVADLPGERKTGQYR